MGSRASSSGVFLHWRLTVASVCIGASLALAAVAAPPVTPLPPSVIISEVKSIGTVWVKGVWTIQTSTDGDRIAEPLNSVKIECDKQRAVCAEAVGTIVGGADSTKAQYLDVEISEFAVTRWTPQEIVAEADALCVSTTLTINLARKEVFKVSRNGGLSTDGCNGMPGWSGLKAPTVVKLTGGLDVLKTDPRLRAR